MNEYRLKVNDGLDFFTAFDTERPSTKVEKAMIELTSIGELDESTFDGICEKHGANKNLCEILIIGQVAVTAQRQAILKHLFEKRNITDIAITKKYKSFRPKARIKEIESSGIVVNARRVKPKGYGAYTRYEFVGK